MPPPILIAPCACPALVVEAESLGISAVQITVTSGTPPVTVRLMGPGVDFTQVGEGPFEFHGLAPNTQYSVVASDECGEGQTVSTTVTTDACPEVIISQEASTPHSVTVEINGDAALVTLGDQQAMVANGGQHTFTGLSPATSYTVRAESACGYTAVGTVTTTACPAISATHTATPHSITVTVTGGAPAQVTLNGQTQTVAADGGTVTFGGLAPNTSYSARVQSACGNEAFFPFATAACPVITVTADENPNSIEITVTQGAPARVTLNGVTQTVAANGGSVVFGGLASNTPYAFHVRSDCGNEDFFTFTTAACPAIAASAAPAVDSLVITVTGGAPARVVLGGITQYVTTNGGSVTFTGLAPATDYVVQVLSDCDNDAIFTFTTLACATIVLGAPVAGMDNFSVEITAGGPADITVYDADGRIIDTRPGVPNDTPQLFSDLAADARYRIVAESSCGSQTVVFATTGVAPCPSRPVYPHGFGYVEGDVVDPEADVFITVVGSDEVIAVYSAPAPGRTAKVRDADGALLGYAQNQSCCTYGGCCSPEEYEGEGATGFQVCGYVTPGLMSLPDDAQEDPFSVTLEIRHSGGPGVTVEIDMAALPTALQLETYGAPPPDLTVAAEYPSPTQEVMAGDCSDTGDGAFTSIVVPLAWSTHMSYWGVSAVVIPAGMILIDGQPTTEPTTFPVTWTHPVM